MGQQRDGWEKLREAIERADDDPLEGATAQYTYAAEPPRGGLRVIGPLGLARSATHFITGTLHEGITVPSAMSTHRAGQPLPTRRLDEITGTIRLKRVGPHST